MNRAQSETTGTVLLLAMVVIAMSVFGYVLLGSIEPDDDPAMDVTATVTDDEVTVVHRGGASVPGDELTVALRYDGTEGRYDFATDGNYGADDRFDGGEQWRLDDPVPYDAGDRVEVVVIHGPSETVLFRGRRVATTRTPTPTPAPPAAPSPPQVTRAAGSKAGV